MTKVNFADARKRAESEGLLGAGSYLKLQEGDNKVRLMSECLEHPGEYQGKPTFKWLCYVLDRPRRQDQAVLHGAHHLQENRSATDES